MSLQIFPVILLNARPAAGKSEIIDYLQKTPLAERQQRFHIGKLDIIDDFPMLWSWFEEDDILTQMGYPRLHTDKSKRFKWPYLWHLLIERINLEYDKRLRDRPDYATTYTKIVEFSRGTEHGGYREAYQHLSKPLLEQTAILYLQVSFEESLRKNRARFNPERPDSILEHALNDEKLKQLYGEDDWETLTAENPEYLEIKGIRVPYAIFENEDDVTTARGKALGERLENTLAHLWKRAAQR